MGITEKFWEKHGVNLVICLGSTKYLDAKENFVMGNEADTTPLICKKDDLQTVIKEVRKNLTERQNTKLKLRKLKDVFKHGHLVKKESMIEGIYFSKQFTSAGMVYANKREAELAQKNYDDLVKPKEKRPRTNEELLELNYKRVVKMMEMLKLKEYKGIKL